MPGNYFVIAIMQFLLKFAAPKNNSSLVLTKFTIHGNYTFSNLNYVMNLKYRYPFLEIQVFIQCGLKRQK